MDRRGHACMIPGTNEFFIALGDHAEWGIAHTVWGEVGRLLIWVNKLSFYTRQLKLQRQVEDMRPLLNMVQQPYHSVTHPDFGTVMRMLDVEIPFQIEQG